MNQDKFYEDAEDWPPQRTLRVLVSSPDHPACTQYMGFLMGQSLQLRTKAALFRVRQHHHRLVGWQIHNLTSRT